MRSRAEREVGTCIARCSVCCFTCGAARLYFSQFMLCVSAHDPLVFGCKAGGAEAAPATSADECLTAGRIFCGVCINNIRHAGRVFCRATPKEDAAPSCASARVRHRLCSERAAAP